MKTKLTLCLAAASLFSLGAGAAEIGSDRCIEMAPTFPGVGYGAIDAGAYSLSTGEQAVASASLVVYLEAADGTAHAAFGVAPRDVLILRTVSGRHVVRIMHPRPDLTSDPAAPDAREASVQR